MYDPWMGYSPAGFVPEYYNPYKKYSAAGVSMDQAQQRGQAGVPGKDTPTPGSKHGARKRVRMMSPSGTKIGDIPEDRVEHWLSRGARRI